MDRELGDPINSPQTGKELRAWRKALGLRQRELARVLGLHPNTIRRAEWAMCDHLKGHLLLAVQLTQHRIVHGEIDFSAIFRERVPRGRPRKDMG